MSDVSHLSAGLKTIRTRSTGKIEGTILPLNHREKVLASERLVEFKEPAAQTFSAEGSTFAAYCRFIETFTTSGSVPNRKPTTWPYLRNFMMAPFSDLKEEEGEEFDDCPDSYPHIGEFKQFLYGVVFTSVSGIVYRKPVGAAERHRSDIFGVLTSECRRSDHIRGERHLEWQSCVVLELWRQTKDGEEGSVLLLFRFGATSE